MVEEEQQVTQALTDRGDGVDRAEVVHLGDAAPIQDDDIVVSASEVSCDEVLILRQM